VLIVDALGCQVSGQINVTDQGGPVINSTVSVDVNCFGNCDGSIVINATGATLFSVDNGLSFNASNTFNNLCAGTYDIVVEDNNGCQAIDQETVSDPVVLSTNFLTIDPLCFGDCNGEIDFSASGGNGSYQYSIDNGVTWLANSLFTGLCAGNYDLIVQDGNGCQTTPTPVSILEPPVLSMILGVTNETCFGACDGMINSIPSGGSGPGTYSYNWSPSLGSSPLISNLCTGNYSLTVTDANGCTVVEDTLIAGPQAVTIDNIITTNELCGGDCTGSISINATGATQYSLDGVNFQATNAFSNLCAGSYTIYVQDASGCLSSDTTSITGPSPINIQAFSDTVICVGGTAQLSALCSGGAGGYVYDWDNGSQAQNIAVSPVSDQIFCVSGTDQNGCASSQLCLTVTVNPDLSILALSDQTISVGDSTGISSLASGGDGGPYTYTWDQGLGLGQNHTVAPSASTIYTVTVSDGCETPDVSASVTISVSPIPSISFSGDNLSGCLPVTTTFNELNVPAGSQCFWNFGDGNVSTDCGPVNHTYNLPGCWDVSLSIITPDGCSSSFTQTQYVCVYDYPTASFSYGPQPTTIMNTTIDFNNQSLDASSYLWTFENGVGTSSSSAHVIQWLLMMFFLFGCQMPLHPVVLI